MRRFAAVDWLLLGTLLPLCLFGLVMSVVHGVRGDFVRSCVLLNSSAPDAQSYPVVRAVQSPCPLAVGDRLVRLQGDDLSGLSDAGYVLRWSAAAQTSHSLLYTIERGGARADVRVTLVPGTVWLGSLWWAPLPFILSLAGTALFLLVRATHWHLARRFYLACMLIAVGSAPYFTPATAPRAWIAVLVLVLPLAFALMFWSACEFIPGVRLWFECSSLRLVSHLHWRAQAGPRHVCAHRSLLDRTDDLYYLRPMKSPLNILNRVAEKLTEIVAEVAVELNGF